jgi:CTP:phosphocholine cytidylyltransferase-like protein
MTEPQSQSKYNRFILTGNNSYIPWLENLENKQSIMDCSTESENSTIIYPDKYEEANTSATQKTLLKKKIVEFKTYILESIDPSKIKVVMKNPIRKILADLARNYGTSNIDASNFKIKLPGKMFFDPLKNPLTTFRWLQN